MSKKITSKTLYINITAFSLLLMLSTESCKKGEEDPFISFRSRKARVAGDWEVTSAEISLKFTIKDSQDNDSIVSQKSKFNGSKVTETTTAGDSVWTRTYNKTLDYAFEKNGDWNSSEITTIVSIDTIYMGADQYETTTTTETITNNSGAWNFMGKVGELKNKEAMIVRTNTSQVTVSGTVNYKSLAGAPAKSADILPVTVNNYQYTESNAIWKIIGLRNKEMKIETAVKDSYSFTSNNTLVEYYKTTGSLSMTLTAN